jgi:hypothetical protein
MERSSRSDHAAHARIDVELRFFACTVEMDQRYVYLAILIVSILLFALVKEGSTQLRSTQRTCACTEPGVKYCERHRRKVRLSSPSVVRALWDRHDRLVRACEMFVFGGGALMDVGAGEGLSTLVMAQAVLKVKDGPRTEVIAYTRKEDRPFLLENVTMNGVKHVVRVRGEKVDADAFASTPVELIHIGPTLSVYETLRDARVILMEHRPALFFNEHRDGEAVHMLKQMEYETIWYPGDVWVCYPSGAFE